MAADGYRLRLVDVPAAFDRDGFYDHPDDPWRFAVLCRAALAALERDGTPLDVLHVHDWHTGPALLERARGIARGDRFFADMAVMLTIHNLAYHGWTGNPQLAQLGLTRRDALAGSNPDGIDLLLTAVERSELVNTVSPGFARGGPDPRVRDGPRPVAAGPSATAGSGSSTASIPTSGTRPPTRRSRRRTRARTAPGRPPAGGTCSSAWASTPTTTARCSG